MGQTEKRTTYSTIGNFYTFWSSVSKVTLRDNPKMERVAAAIVDAIKANERVRTWKP